MADIPNIRLKYKAGETYGEVTDLDTGEPIKNIAAINFSIDANRRDQVALVQLTCYIEIEYEGPAETLPWAETKIELESVGQNTYLAPTDQKRCCDCSSEDIERVFAEKIVPSLASALEGRGVR